MLLVLYTYAIHATTYTHIFKYEKSCDSSMGLDRLLTASWETSLQQGTAATNNTILRMRHCVSSYTGPSSYCSKSELRYLPIQIVHVHT